MLFLLVCPSVGFGSQKQCYFCVNKLVEIGKATEHLRKEFNSQKDDFVSFQKDFESKKYDFFVMSGAIVLGSGAQFFILKRGGFSKRDRALVVLGYGTLCAFLFGIPEKLKSYRLSRINVNEEKRKFGEFIEEADKQLDEYQEQLRNLSGAKSFSDCRMGEYCKGLPGEVLNENLTLSTRPRFGQKVQSSPDFCPSIHTVRNVVSRLHLKLKKEKQRL